MIHIKPRYLLKTFQTENGDAPYSTWRKELERTTRARIDLRIARFENGYFGDHKSVGDNVLEARFFFGPGYRVYFSIIGSELILLLAGGDKSSQSRDIDKAKYFLKIYMEDQNAN